MALRLTAAVLAVGCVGLGYWSAQLWKKLVAAETQVVALKGQARQAAAHREVIARFGRFPHRNAVLGRASTPEEAAYVTAGDFVHLRRPPGG